MRSFFLGIFALLVCWPSSARADILFYRIPGTNVVFVLQGTVSAGRPVTLRHPRFGNLYFSLKDVRYHKVPAARTLADGKLRKAVRDEDVDACLETGRWALHHGLLPEFYEAASAAWKLDHDHPTVKRLVALKQKIDAPLPESAQQEQEMRKYVAAGDRMTVATSKHFLLLHDTTKDRTKERRSRKTRAEYRLDLLETVYESFLLKFCLEGLDLDVPRKRLEAVLFAEKQDYVNLGILLKAPELAKTAGFYSRERNIAVFFDQGTNEIFQLLDALNRQLQAAKQVAIRRRAPGAKDLVRFINTIQHLTEVSREEADIETVSHEVTHQMAANTGLMPNDAPVPLWAAEGLATYFESPKQAAWSGIGVVNEGRLDAYRGLAHDRVHSSIDFVVSDAIFTHAGSDGDIVHAYGQAWALTHFLMERHFDELIKYYQMIAQQRPPRPLSNAQRRDAFAQIFGNTNAALEMEWRSYMHSLKTDVERVLETN